MRELKHDGMNLRDFPAQKCSPKALESFRVVRGEKNPFSVSRERCFDLRMPVQIFRKLVRHNAGGVQHMTVLPHKPHNIFFQKGIVCASENQGINGFTFKGPEILLKDHIGFGFPDSSLLHEGH